MTRAAAVRTFLVECYLPGVEEPDVAAAAQRARDAVTGLVREGAQIEYLGAALIPQDEVVFHAFGASDAAVVARASREAELRFERIVESVTVDGATVLGRLSAARTIAR